MNKALGMNNLKIVFTLEEIVLHYRHIIQVAEKEPGHEKFIKWAEERAGEAEAGVRRYYDRLKQSGAIQLVSGDASGPAEKKPQEQGDMFK